MKKNDEVTRVASLDMPESGVAGIGYRLLISAAETGGAYELMYFVVPPGAGSPMHVHHREDECAYTLEGELQGIVGGQKVKTPAGTALHLPRNVPHACSNTGAMPAKFLMWVTPGRLEGFYAACQRPWDLHEENLPPDETELAGLVELAAQFDIEIIA